VYLIESDEESDADVHADRAHVVPFRTKSAFVRSKSKHSKACVIESDEETAEDDHVDGSQFLQIHDMTGVKTAVARQSAVGASKVSMETESGKGKILSENSSEISSGVTVQKSNKSSTKVFDKVYYCPICYIGVVHLPRHLYTLHSDDSAVAQAMNATGVRKQHLLTHLRNLGSHLHNTEVLRTKTGSLSVIYRPSKARTVKENEYLPCMYCYGYFQKRQLWRHVRKCPLKSESKPAVKAVHAGKLLLDDDKNITKSVKELIWNMRAGCVKLVIHNDRLLQAVAGKMLKRVNSDKAHFNNIRARLRKLARVILHVRRSNSALSSAKLKDILTPKHFQAVLSAVKAVAGYDEENNSFVSPSVGVDLGRDLKKCVLVLKGQALTEGDRETVKYVKNFLELCTDEWNYEVSGGARRILRRRKANRNLVLPLASDVTKLNAHLHEVQKISMASLNKPDKDDNFATAFRNLESSILAQLILFNRRRPGEVSKLEIAAYVENCDQKYHSLDAVNSLSPLEKQMLSTFTRIEVPGKRDNVVPILITASQKSAIDVLISAEHRSVAGIAQENPYVFAASMGSMSHLRGNDCLRIFAQQCGAQNPLELKSTALRKHVASFSQIINLKEYEMDQLAGFLGHNIRIHRDYYRLPLDVVQTAKVGRILLAMEKGCISQYSGKTLDDIEISPQDGMALLLLLFIIMQPMNAASTSQHRKCNRT